MLIIDVVPQSAPYPIMNCGQKKIVPFKIIIGEKKALSEG
jgi:hypothetical protein